MKTSFTHPQPFFARHLFAGALAIAALLICALACRADITNGLVGYWKLADGPGSSTVADSSGSNNLGTLTNFSDATFMNMWTTNSDPANLFPYALLFNQGAETSDFVNIPDSASLDTIPVLKAFTLSAWVNLSAASTSGTIICKGASGGESWWLGVNNSQFRVFMRNSSGNSTQTATAGTTVPIGTWTHVAGSYKPAGTPHVVLYINGVRAADSGAATLTTVHATAAPASIGNYTNASAPFPGTIDEVRVFNRTLTDNDVFQLYTNGPGDIIVSQVPYFVQEPTNSVNLAQGSNLVVSATAGGTAPLAYQWYETNVTAQTGFALTGQTNASLDLPNVQTNDSYFLQVTNNYGSTNSIVVVVGVFAGPMFTSQLPVPNTNFYTLFAGASPTFSVSAVSLQSNQPVTYQWFTNGVAGATTSNLTFTNVQADSSFTNYCVATNPFGSTTSIVWAASVIAAPTALYPQSVIALNPIGYWRLDEPDDTLGDGNHGAIAHDFWGGNNGIYTNTVLGNQGYNTNTDPSETSAQFGILYSFTDDNAYGIAADFASPTNTSAAFTVEAWVDGYSQTKDAGIVSKGYGGAEQFSLDTGSDGGSPSHAFRFLVRDVGGTVHAANSSVYPDPSGAIWHHLAGVCDEANSNITLYVDGVATATATIAPGSGILSSARSMLIGSRPSSSTSKNDDQLVGFVDDVSVYNYALSASQVAQQYFSLGFPPALILSPTNSITVNEGGTLVLPALASGTPPLTNAWVDVGNGTNVSAGVTNGNVLNATLTVNNVPVGWNGDQLELMVSNAFGVTNITVQLTVLSGPPQITANVPASLTLYAGRTETYSVAATGTEPFYYQWYQNGSAIPNATNSAYAATAQLSANTYYCAVSNNYSGGSIVFSPTGSLAAVTAPTNLYPMAVLSNNPVAYWRLDETGANAFDYVGGHTAYYTNVQQGVPGYSPLDPDLAAGFGVLSKSNSLVGELDQSGSGLANIDFSQPSGGNAEFSVEAWVNCPASQSGGGCIVARGYGNGGEQFLLDLGGGGNTFRFRVRNAAGTAFGPNAAVGADGKWHHLAGVCDEVNGNVWLYVDGVPANGAIPAGSGVQPARSGSAGLGDIRVSIGARTSASSSTSFNSETVGTIDEVALYNTALSSSQVLAHYLAGHLVAPGFLTISNTSGQVQVIWNFSGTLQSATNVSGPYAPVSGANSPYTVPPTNTQMFFRVQQQ